MDQPRQDVETPQDDRASDHAVQDHAVQDRAVQDRAVPGHAVPDDRASNDGAPHVDGPDTAPSVTQRGSMPATAKEPSRTGRYQLIFAVVGVVLALGASALYLLKNSAQPERRTPEDAVSGFLTAIFVQSDRDRVGEFVCGSWDPTTAITRTVGQVDPQARVSWDSIVKLDSTDERANVLARLGYRYPDDTQPSVHRRWRFRVVNEEGWRVCDARMLVE